MKRKIALFYLLICCAYTVMGQSSSAVQSLVTSEKTFVQQSKDKGTKEAFLSNLAEKGILFKPGPVNGKEFWQQIPEDNSLLTWEPVFAIVSSAGDIGFTTGPFSQFQNKTDAQPAGGGSYISVWKKENGEWKVVLDIGIGHPPVQTEKEQFTDLKKNNSQNQGTYSDIAAIETEFINEQQKSGWAAYGQYISSNARIYRPMSVPATDQALRDKLFSETDKKFSYEHTAGEIASSGDLAYVYGKVKIEITRDGNTRTLNGNYLRVWTRDENANWKIALDLVNVAR